MALSSEYSLKHFVDFCYGGDRLVQLQVIVGCLHLESDLLQKIIEFVDLFVDFLKLLLHELLVSVLPPVVPESLIQLIQPLRIQIHALAKNLEIVGEVVLPLLDLVDVEHDVLHFHDADIDNALQPLLALLELLVDFSLADPQLVLVVVDDVALLLHVLQIDPPLLLNLPKLLISIILHRPNLLQHARQARLLLLVLHVLVVLLALQVVEDGLLFHYFLNHKLKLIDLALLIVLIHHDPGHVRRIMQTLPDDWLDHLEHDISKTSFKSEPIGIVLVESRRIEFQRLHLLTQQFLLLLISELPGVEFLGAAIGRGHYHLPLRLIHNLPRSHLLLGPHMVLGSGAFGWDDHCVDYPVLPLGILEFLFGLLELVLEELLLLPLNLLLNPVPLLLKINLLLHRRRQLLLQVPAILLPLLQLLLFLGFEFYDLLLHLSLYLRLELLANFGGLGQL